ncbi:MAG: GPR1/FUN34/YaaH family transporter [Ktedonobacteraceae bacterium]
MAQYAEERPQGPVASAAVSTVANPAPLGLCGFALTTFVLSCINAGFLAATDLKIVVGLALFYGGLAQLLAGMWEFRSGNTFGATAFSSYGAFWLAVAGSIQFGWITSHTAFGFFLLGWTIFTFIMLLGTLRTNGALIAVFVLLVITFLLLTIGEFGGGTGVLGGYFGILTAIAAWYAALAGVLDASRAPFRLPVFPMS